MTYHLDEALRNIPSEPYPSGLADRVIHRLRRHRRRQRFLQQTGWVSAGAAAAVGMFLFSHWVAEHQHMMPVFSAGSIVQWTGKFTESPLQTSLGSMMSFWDWVQMILGSGWVSVVALALLLLSAFWTLGKLLIDTDMDEMIWA